LSTISWTLEATMYYIVAIAFGIHEPFANQPPDEIDFTPYWRRPIPPSYFPD
jgi:hypothetical protein